jgi:hypothetical protein
MQKGPPIAPLVIAMLVLAIMIIFVVIGLVVFAGNKTSDLSQRDADILQQSQAREKARIETIRRDERAQTLPEDWNVYDLLEFASHDAFGEVSHIAIDAAWEDGDFDELKILDLIEAARDGLPEGVEERFSEDRIISGAAIADFKVWLIESIELTAVKDAALAGQCSFEIDLLDQYPDGVESRYHVAALLAIRAVLQADDEQYENALTTFAAAYELGFSARSEPALYCHDRAHWMFWIVDECLDSVAQDFPDLDRLAERLGPYFERRRESETIRKLFQEEIDLAPVRFGREFGDEQNPFAGVFAGVSELTYGGLEASGIEFMGLLDQPYHEIESQMDDLIFDNFNATEPTTDLLYDLQDTYLIHLQSEAIADVFPIAISLMKFAREHGEYPAQIGSGSPIPMPIDPIVGEPMIYLRLDKGFVIASPIAEAGQSSNRFVYWSTGRD